MNSTPVTTNSGNGGTLDPQHAAALLSQTTRQTRRQLQPAPPWLLVTRAVMVLVTFGGIYLSVRGQHPYHGPTTSDIPVLVAFVVINLAATVAVRQRALAGVRGRSRLRPAEITIAVGAWAAVVLLLIALAGAGVSYVDYPTTVLIIPGLVWAALSAARKDRLNCATGLAVVVVGVVGLYAGPAGSWAVAGVGLCVMLLGRAFITERWQRG
jgi:hypothetical protein